MDDLDDYEPSAALFEDIDINPPSPPRNRPTDQPTRKRPTDDLGLDDEVEVRTKRINVKLDEARYVLLCRLPRCLTLTA